MDQERKSRLIRYISWFAVGCGIVLFVLALNGFFSSDTRENMQILADAFLTAGAFMILFSLMIYVSDEGGLLGIGYALGSVWRVFFPVSTKPRETYAEYRERKTGERKKRDHSMMLTGLFFFAISIVFLVIWSNL